MKRPTEITTSIHAAPNGAAKQPEKLDAGVMVTLTLDELNVLHADVEGRIVRLQDYIVEFPHAADWNEAKLTKLFLLLNKLEFARAHYL